MADLGPSFVSRRGRRSLCDLNLLGAELCRLLRASLDLHGSQGAGPDLRNLGVVAGWAPNARGIE